MDDGSNGSLLAAFAAVALIGGILLTLQAVWALSRINDDLDEPTTDAVSWGTSGSNSPTRPWNTP